MGTSRPPLLRAGVLALLTPAFGLLSMLSAQVMHPREYQITMSVAHETWPAVGNDGISDLVVFTMQVQLPSGQLAPADVWYQRVGLTGPFGPSVQVTADFTDDQFPDVFGDHIVYVAYDEVGSQQGRILLYRISTRESWILDEGVLQKPHIHGHFVIWGKQLGPDTWTVELYDLDWLGTTQGPLTAAGPVPSAIESQIGSRFLVWTEHRPFPTEQRDVEAFDLDRYVRLGVTNSSGWDDMLPSTSGGWIVWMSQRQRTYPAAILAMNLETFDERVIVEDATYNVWPDVEGDLVTYASQADGDLDLYLYRFSSQRTYRITADDVDQKPPRVLGDKLAYFDARNGHDDDVYLTVLDWAPVAHAGADRIVTERAWVTLDGRASLDENGEALHYAWSQTAGPAVVLQGADGPQPEFLAPEVDRAGAALAFELVVTAGAHASAPDAVEVFVQNLNRPPVAHAGEPQVANEKGPPILLDGTGCLDPDGDPMTCQWIQLSGPPVELVGASTPKAWFSPPRVRPPCEELKFRLVVSDGEAKDEDFTTVTVRSVRRVKVP